MSGRHIAILLATAALLAAPPATAKEFEPGDLRVCGAKRCVTIWSRPALAALSRFYYTARKPPPIAPRVRLGAPAYELRFDNGYVTGIVATRRLDRFLSYGVHLGWFKRGRWHRVPERAAEELSRLTTGLGPLRVTRAMIAKSR